jgi:ADP-ribosylglycohydrolase
MTDDTVMTVCLLVAVFSVINLQKRVRMLERFGEAPATATAVQDAESAEEK